MRMALLIGFLVMMVGITLKADPFTLPYNNRMISWEMPVVAGKVKTLDEKKYWLGKTDGTPSSSMRYTFDENGRIVEQCGLQVVTGQPELPISYKYDGQGRMIAFEGLGFDKTLAFKGALTYAPEGKSCQIEQRDNQDKIFSKGSVKLNEKQLPVEFNERADNASPKPPFCVLKYDEQGRLQEVGSGYFNDLEKIHQTKSTFRYNDKGLLEEEQRLEASFKFVNNKRVVAWDLREKLTYAYEYDAQGSWVTRNITQMQVDIFHGNKENTRLWETAPRVIQYR